MTTKDRYLAQYRPGGSARSVESLADFLEAVVRGEDLWHGSPNARVSWSSQNGTADYNALTALGWSAGADYGSYGCEDLSVYSPHPQPSEDSDENADNTDESE